MTRNERIAERIRKTWHAEDVCERVHDAFLDGEFDDLLGPAVSAEVVATMRREEIDSERWFIEARLCLDHARVAVDGGHSGSRWVELAMDMRRLAKFMRALERSAA